MSMLSVTELAGGYPGTRVLDGVNLDLDEGRILALLGRNGVGKTTLVHTLMGMLHGSGSVTFGGKELLGLSTFRIARRGIALVPQGRRVFGPLTVAENLRIATAHAGPGRWTPAEIYKLFPRLDERRGFSAGQLSGGEQEMLSIGRALVTNPRLLLLDEPSDGLAPSIVNAVGDVVRTLTSEGVTVLLVEQNLAMALRVADEVVVMRKGRIDFRGVPGDLRNDDDRVRELLGVS